MVLSYRIELTDCYAIGRLYTVRLDDEIRRLIEEKFGGGSSTTMASRFLRACVRKTEFYSQQYTRMKSRNSYAICYRGEDGVEKFGLVQYYLSLSHTSVAVIIALKPISHHCFPHHLRELKKSIITVNKELSLSVIPISSFLFKCVYVNSCGVDYITKPPYLQLYDD